MRGCLWVLDRGPTTHHPPLQERFLPWRWPLEHVKITPFGFLPSPDSRIPSFLPSRATQPRTDLPFAAPHQEPWRPCQLALPRRPRASWRAQSAHCSAPVRLPSRTRAPPRRAACSEGLTRREAAPVFFLRVLVPRELRSPLNPQPQPFKFTPCTRKVRRCSFRVSISHPDEYFWAIRFPTKITTHVKLPL